MSLHLDTRQRAMLAEMGVRVWWPESESEPVRNSVQQVSVAAPSHSPALTVQVDAQPVQVAPPSSATAMPTVSRVLQTALASSNAQNPSIQFPPCPEVSLLEWPALREATQVCQSCALSLTRKQAVFGAGALSDSDGQVDWLVIAESPNDEEQTQGEPFVGDAGVLLDNMLSACGLSRTLQTGRGRVFVTHATKCSPPGGRNAKPQEWEQCQTYLHRQIELLRPRMILAMGRLSANALLRENLPDVQALPLGKLRGQVHQFRGTPVVVTFHPAYVMRNLHEKAKVWADLCLAQAQLSDH